MVMMVNLEAVLKLIKTGVLIAELRILTIGTDRSRDFSAGPETAGFRFCFRLAGFCRTGTGCFEGKFSVCRTQPEIFTFCHEHMKILLLS